MTSTPPSHSEGEILTSDSEKASQTLPSRNGISVDRPTRTTASSVRNSRSRSRSPYRPRRGEKRRREDGNAEYSVEWASRSQKARHESGSRHLSDRARGRGSHTESGLGSRRRAQHVYDREFDRHYSSKLRITRSRSRSRSPFRHSHVERKPDVGASLDQSKLAGSARQVQTRGIGSRYGNEQSVSERGESSGVALALNPDAKITEMQSSQVESRHPPDTVVNGLNADASTVKEADAAALATVVDEATLIEERRRRREALKAKYRSQDTPLPVQAFHPVTDVNSSTSSSMQTPEAVGPSTVAGASGAKESVFHLDPAEPTTPQTPREDVHSPAEINFEQGENLANYNPGSVIGEDDEPSAADYDPTVDMQEERARHDKRLFNEGISMADDQDQKPLEHGETGADASTLTASQGQSGGFKKAKDPFDMFADDEDEVDMFAEAAVKPEERAPASDAKAAQSLDVGMMDNWDDAEGYYMTIPGELFESRYHVLQNLGRGMFSSVVRATDTKTNKLVAIKIVRNNDTMRKAGLREIEILKDLAANDPEDRKHIIRLERSFEHKGHLCMVFENLSLNLREVLKKFGRDVGINIKAIRAYAQQLFLGLSLLRKCQYLHADLKPDNMLVNEGRNVVKICDLGSASSVEENATAPYLVSRFYRAPEIILGVPYDYGIDVWSVGCTLFELYTGKILFTGRNNNGMLRSIMECRGKFPHKVLRKGSLTYQYFDDLLNFHAVEEDKLTGRTVTKMIEIKTKPVRGLRERLVPKGKRMDEQERKEVELFADLLDKCLDLRADKRTTPSEALRHPFITRAKS